MTFCNMIGTTALINVKSFLDKFKDPERVEEYVRSGLLYHGEIPFLYRVFEPSDVPSSKEKGGYKVVSRYTYLAAKQPGAYLIRRLAVDHFKINRLSTQC